MATWKKVLTESDIATADGLGTSDTVVPSQGAVKTYVDANVSTYSLPLSSSSTRGGVKIGYSENGKNYPVELSSEKMFVNVPWTDANTTTTADVKTALNADMGGAFTVGDSNDTMVVAGTIRAGANEIETSNGTTAITLVANASTIALAGNLQVNGNNIVASTGVTALTLSGANVTVAGNLTVSGTTTTVNSTTVEVADKLIKLANVATPTTTTGSGGGVQIETSGTEAQFPEFKWTKDLGGGNTSGAGTANGLTGWTLSNHRTSNQADHYISIMDFGTADASGNSAGVGS